MMKKFDAFFELILTVWIVEILVTFYLLRFETKKFLHRIYKAFVYISRLAWCDSVAGCFSFERQLYIFNFSYTFKINKPPKVAAAAAAKTITNGVHTEKWPTDKKKKESNSRKCVFQRPGILLF